MSLENEYYHWKKMIENEHKKLAQFESIDISDKTTEQIEARERGIKMCKEDIEEYTEIFEEIKGELSEFIKNGGEVSELTKKEFENDEEHNNFMCIYENQSLFVDVVYDSEGMPDFKYHFGTRDASKDNPILIGEMIIALESKVFNICQLLKTEKENWTCKLNDKIEISHTVDLFNFESKEVELPTMAWEIQGEYPEMFDD